MAEDEAPDGIRQKLVDTKQRWAREGRLLTGEHAPPEQRLPPSQRLVRDWPVLDLGVQPAVAEETFRLDVEGLVERPVTLDWRWLMELEQAERVNDIHCVTQWSRYDNRWGGIAVSTLLELVRPKSQARFVEFGAYDGYTTNLSLEDFARPENILAHSWEGERLTRQHGGPLRVVVPHLYFWKSTKWVKRITFLAQNKPGFWEQRGYHDRGDPWMEERYG
ncbi:sulfite oxidase-like oxidoreductase [Teichococcus oryzae]|uniref:Sulfite oxidase-like oxidoreductase n=1 Tax=Teichococcus oryzae TaxID=1608942 RepID=A0A5B2TL89_9PROT|nr:sulfite oxidase-like oxidoreductase [Pseudoroseomonas oryzae]KAA2214944.1 sulfite oxidase-like oxidoreductase [Pseudoroseomonas oryzae]